MKFRPVQKSISQLTGELIVCPVYKDQAWGSDLKELDDLLNGKLSTLAKKVDFEAKSGECLPVGPLEDSNFERVLLLGLGKKEETPDDLFLEYAARAVKSARKWKVGKMLILPENTSCNRQLTHIACGIRLGDYRFDTYLSEKKKEKNLQVDIMVAKVDKKSKDAVARGDILGESVCFSRDLVNEPANTLTPAELANRAKKMAQNTGIRVSVMDEKAIRKERMNLFLAVGSGSTANRPRLIHCVLTPPKTNTKGKARKVFLIGKGVTFDSGGLNLKPGSSMEGMKTDMAGAAAVLGAMKALSKLGVQVEVHALIAATENMVDGHSYRPGDVLISRSGKSVEIDNTDAEGRLTLADAIDYAKSLGADEIFDIATLTGACMVALGPVTAGILSNDDQAAAAILQCGKASGEDFWRLPLNKKLKKQLKSEVADMKNCGTRYGGAITAGLFLQDFAGETPWVHLDIAGPSRIEDSCPHLPKGGSGFGVATLVEYLCPLS